MERVTSAEDVKWCIDGGTQQAFSRNGSELGLQEFVRGLSSIPSFSSCLAQLGDSTSATCGGDDKTVQAPAFSTIGEGQGIPSAAEAEAGAQAAGQLPTNLTPEAYSRGIARVPSLEVMKMLMGPSNQLYSPTVPLVRRPEQQSASEAFGGASPMNGVQQIPTSVTTALLQGGVIPPAPHSAILTMNPAVAAAAAFSQLTNGGVMPQTMDMELLEKSEQRRKRRMLSNRESARRSRKRKQEHLHTLEEERDRLREEKNEWLQLSEKLTRRCQGAEEECIRLKDENKRLREELRILGLVKSELFQSRKQLAAGDDDEEESEK